MAKYKVLGGTWGEGYMPGDIINLDCNAARGRLAEGHLEEVLNPVEAEKAVLEAKEAAVAAVEKAQEAATLANEVAGVSAPAPELRVSEPVVAPEPEGKACCGSLGHRHKKDCQEVKQEA